MHALCSNQSVTLELLQCMHSYNPDAAKKIQEMTKGGVHHAIEAVGRPASGDLAVASLRRGGTATILGMILTGRLAVRQRSGSRLG